MGTHTKKPGKSKNAVDRSTIEPMKNVMRFMCAFLNLYTVIENGNPIVKNKTIGGTIFLRVSSIGLANLYIGLTPKLCGPLKAAPNERRVRMRYMEKQEYEKRLNAMPEPLRSVILSGNDIYLGYLGKRQECPRHRWLVRLFDLATKVYRRFLTILSCLDVKK